MPYECRWPLRPEKVLDSLELELQQGCDQPNVGAGNQKAPLNEQQVLLSTLLKSFPATSFEI